MSEARRGLGALLLAFAIWGLLPLYLHALRAVSAGEVMAYRLVGCCVFVLAWLAVRRELGLVRAALATPSTRLKLALSALLISANWLIYVWAVAHGRTVEASLGYFINPLVNVLLGVLVLREHLNRAQWLAVALAGTGVVYLTVQAGAPPFIALVLALSFGSYGLIRKTVQVEALAGLASETAIIAPLGLAYIAALEWAGTGALVTSRGKAAPLLLLGGPLTAIPLWLFSYGARRVPYSTVGLVQYIGPTLQLLVAVLALGEPFPLARAAGFAFIWLALAVYAGEGLYRASRRESPLSA